MKLAHVLLDNPIRFEENRINILVIENKRMLARLIYEMLGLTEGEEGSFVLSENDNELSFGCVDVITDVFRLDVNSRRNIGKLISALEKAAVDEQFYEASCRIMGDITSYVLNVSGALDYNVDISEVKLADIFKLCSTRFDFDDDNICGGVLDYMKITRDIAQMRLFVFVNLKQLLDAEDIELFYNNIIYNKYNVLLIESEYGQKLPVEKYKIIDKDLCEIA